MELAYTSSDSVRSALGVSEKEISEAQITALNLNFQLELELDEVYADHAAIKAAVDSLSPTTEQLRIWKLLVLFCQYQGAVFMLPGLQNYVAQKISDGGFEMQRFSKDDLEKTKAEITGMRDKYSMELQALTDSTASEPPSYIVLVIPQFNPVTNEGA